MKKLAIIDLLRSLRVGLQLAVLLFLICGQAWATQMPEELVGADADDGYERNVLDCNEIKDYVCMRYATSGCYYGFYRFTSVPIAQGATIDACTLFVNVDNASYDDPNITIHCEDTASATTLDGENTCITSRTRTTANVNWIAEGIETGYKPSPELKTIVQEIVNRGDWSSGNDMAFIFVVNDGSAFYTKSYEVTEPAKLHCWYTVGDGVASQIIIVH